MSEQLIRKLSKNDDINNEINFFDLLVILARHKKIVIFSPIVVGALALAISFFIEPVFSSSAKILPPQQQQSSGMAAMLGQLGGLAGAAGGIPGLKSPNDLYVGLLESRTVADSLISRFNLKERYEKKTMDDTRKVLAENSVIGETKTGGFITIVTNDKDPQFAAKLANGYVNELITLTQTIALTEASQRRLFFQEQLKDARDQLASAEMELRNTQEKTGLIRPEAQVPAIISALAQLTATIAAKEVQINGIRTFATGQNPFLLRAEEELRSLQSQLAKLEENQSLKKGDFNVPIGKIPEVGIEYMRSVRNVKYYEVIFELLAKQFELAKIDEAKESSVVQLLDAAIPAERKSKPNRKMIVLLGVLAGGIFGIIYAFLKDAYKESKASPESRNRWTNLISAWNGTASK